MNAFRHAGANVARCRLFVHTHCRIEAFSHDLLQLITTPDLSAVVRAGSQTTAPGSGECHATSWRMWSITSDFMPLTSCPRTDAVLAPFKTFGKLRFSVTALGGRQLVPYPASPAASAACCQSSPTTCSHARRPPHLRPSSRQQHQLLAFQTWVQTHGHTTRHHCQICEIDRRKTRPHGDFGIQRLPAMSVWSVVCCFGSHRQLQ